MNLGHVFFQNESDPPSTPTTLRVEIPRSMHEMRQGLAGRAAIRHDSGMLFDMGVEGYHRFHMIGVAFPLDFIFVRSDHRVAAILPSRAPGVPEVAGMSRWVIEAPSGWAAEHRLREGALVTFA